MSHVDFPFPEMSTPPTSGYLSNFMDGSWILHAIQRNDFTWNLEEYSKTIQSIFSNILISPFVGSLQADGVTTLLLDGGHRTLAMLRFVKNEFKVCPPSSNKSCFYKDLCMADKKIFDDRRPLHTFVYTNLTKAQEELLFFRLNIGLPLSSGEAVRAFYTIPICVLASSLSEEYDQLIQGSLARAVMKKNERHDAASFMLLILQNFQAGKVIIGENPGPSKQTENLERCERYRNVEIDEAELRRQTTILMGIVKNKKITTKFPCYVVPTIQAIMLRYPDESPDKIGTFLFSMFETNASVNPLVNEWIEQGRTKKANPAKPIRCEERAKIFAKWLKSA